MPPAKKQQTGFIDLRKEVLIQVDGADEKLHVLDWEILKNLCDNFQKLIHKLTKYSLEKESIPLDQLRVQFIGFYPGSAVPAIRIAEAPNLLFPTEHLYKSLNGDFNYVVACVDKGNFQAIADRYNEPNVKNDIVGTVYDFTNSAGTKPLNFVKRVDGKNKFTKLATIRHMSPKQRSMLVVPELTTTIHIADTKDVEAVGKFILKTTPSGRKQKKEVQLYTQKEAVLSLRFDSIEANNRIYILRNEVYFSITEDKKSHHVTIENPSLDIYATGEDLKAAELDMYEQFDYTYQRLNDIPDDKLSNHLLTAKRYINLLVETVKRT
ncbi:MAG: hypothetical protein JNK14_21510 [Chitinophagaceae bacterium]|nr:hypothetical protein [Chitinophagaceae bacterium]